MFQTSQVVFLRDAIWFMVVFMQVRLQVRIVVTWVALIVNQAQNRTS